MFTLTFNPGPSHALFANSLTILTSFLKFVESIIRNEGNPELILLGGSVSSAYDYFKDSMLNEISKWDFSTMDIFSNLIMLARNNNKHSNPPDIIK